MEQDEALWIQTFSNVEFHPFAPHLRDFKIEDIAHSLAMQCRFNGHTYQFYSVAQHSILVSQYVPAEHALCGLLHDASEAYLCDIPRPLKQSSSFRDYHRLEDQLMFYIAQRFHFQHPLPEIIKTVDEQILHTEARHFMRSPSWVNPKLVIDTKIEPLAPMQAKAEFLSRFNELF